MASTTLVRTPSSRCEFGIASIDITPPVGMYHRMWGAAAHDRSTGIHRPLRAMVVVMRPLARIDFAQKTGEKIDAPVNEAATAPRCSSEIAITGGLTPPRSPNQSSAQTVLVSLDHCLLRAQEMEALLSESCRLTGLSRTELLVTFTHTHSAGYLSRDRAEMPGGDLIGPYLDALPNKIAEAFRDATANVQQVTLTYGSTTCEMGCHRDYFDDVRGHFVCGFNPDAAEPLPLNVVRVTADVGRAARLSGEPPVLRATIVNYPCHTTTLAWENTLVSPDYVGALREVVERETNAPCLFLLAPCGDIGPRDGFVGDTSVADRNGRHVGFAALSVLEGLPPTETDHVYAGPVFSGATLGAWQHRAWSDERMTLTAIARSAQLSVPLPYLSSLPKLADAEQRHQELIADEQAARAAGRFDEAAELRTLVERQIRLLHRIRPLPQGEAYPCPAWAWQWGEAFWIAAEGESYHFLQSELARRFPQRPLIAITLANGTNCSYLPTREAYSKSQLYQPEVALVAPGSLEHLTDAIGQQLAEWDTL